MKVNQYIKKKENEKEVAGEFEIVYLKNLDNDNKEDKKTDKFKKYSFPVKKFKDQDKTLKSQKRKLEIKRYSVISYIDFLMKQLHHSVHNLVRHQVLII